MVCSSLGLTVRASWPHQPGDLICIYQLGKGSINQRVVCVRVCVIYDELGYFKWGITLDFSSSSSSSCFAPFLLSALK